MLYRLLALAIMIGLCVRCGISIPSARNRCPAFDKNKYLESMFGDVGQARTKADMLLLPIVTTSNRTCTKTTVGGSLFFSSIIFLFFLTVSVFLNYRIYFPSCCRLSILKKFSSVSFKIFSIKIPFFLIFRKTLSQIIYNLCFSNYFILFKFCNGSV